MPNKPLPHSPPGARQEARQRDAARGNANQRGYNHRWRKASKAYLDEHPLCVACEAKGRLTPATVVDHVEPHRGDQEAFWRESNWQSLCGECHNSKTGKGQ